MVRQVALGFAVVPLGDEIQERLVLVVVGERLVDDAPADRSPSLDRRERVTESRAVRPQTPERALLLVPVGVTQAQAVAGGLRDGANGIAVLDRVHEPVPAV